MHYLAENILSPSKKGKIKMNVVLSNGFFRLKILEYSLSHFKPVVSSYTPGRHQKTGDFLTFSVGVDQWYKMG